MKSLTKHLILAQQLNDSERREVCWFLLKNAGHCDRIRHSCYLKYLSSSPLNALPCRASSLAIA